MYYRYQLKDGFDKRFMTDGVCRIFNAMLDEGCAFHQRCAKETDLPVCKKQSYTSQVGEAFHTALHVHVGHLSNN